MSLSNFQEASKKAALAALQGSPATLTEMQSAYSKHFPTEPLSTTRQTYSNNTQATNAPLEAAISATLDVADSALTALAAMEQYITLTLPKMDDGNNFGVTVQLAALKHINETQEKLLKATEEVLKYSGARADSMEKCKLPSASTTKTTSKTESQSEGSNAEKGDISSNEKKTSTEEKSTETITNMAESALRVHAVMAVDLTYYTKAKALYQSAMTGFAAAADFCDKNAEKIDAPRGSRGSGTVYASMY